MHYVLASSTEDNIGTIFNTDQQPTYMRNILLEIYHPQPYNPIIANKSSI